MLHRHRPVSDITPTPDAALDDAGLSASEAAALRAEHHLRLLGELTEIGMDLARSAGALAKDRVAAAVAEKRAPSPEDTAALADFNKIAQTVRRTIALSDRLDGLLAARRTGLATERARRRADRDADHVRAKADAVELGVHDAYAMSVPHDEYCEQAENVLEDVRDHLRDADEFRGWLDRPVGETVRRLCDILGLEADACVQDGETWTVRRAPTELDSRAARRPCKPCPPQASFGGLLLVRSVDGQDASGPRPATDGAWRGVNDTT